VKPQFYLFPFFLLFICCVKRITPPIREGVPVLVVEGMITTDSAPYVVKLSYTGNYTNASVSIDSNQSFINDASVIIKDGDGDSAACYLISPGTYQTTDSNFVGIVGHSYTLEVYLSNGKTYISSAEKINQVPPIDSITVVYDSTYITDVRPSQLIITANTRDPVSMQNYYRWTASGYIPRKSWGSPCGVFNPPCTTAFSCVCGAFCEQSFSDAQVNILSDQLINGNEIHQPVDYSPLYSQGKHYIDIRQFSLNQDIYIFWEQYNAQTDRTGSILDPLPAPLSGNIHNATDSNDVALGYFAASAVIEKRIVITPFFLQTYLLESIAGEYAPMGDCHSDFPNSLPDDTSPQGWENAEEIDLH
jgi:Domain of unknown function (DUF4249)